MKQRTAFSDPSTASPQVLSLSEWARSLAPRLDVVSVSAPEPALLPGDLLAVFPASQEARPLVLAWERIEPADQSVGFVALGRGPDRLDELARSSGADPEGVAGHTGRRVLVGAIPGALVGAAVVAVVVGLIAGWSATVIGAALGGAMFGAVAGAVMVFAARTGWGTAYEHSFVDPAATAFAVVSFHSGHADRVERARAAAGDVEGAQLARVRNDGSVTPLWASDRSLSRADAER